MLKVKKVNIRKRSYKGVKVGFLPKEHHFAHSFCFFIHDLIVQTLVEGEKAEIFNISIKNIPHEKITSFKSSKNIIEWLEINGYEDESLILLFKQIFSAMISDFGHFVYEALDCSQKGKLSVTFALLRKAFKDHLIYFEWLLGDPEDFMKVFKNGDVNKLALDKNVEKKKEIIKKSLQKLIPYWGDAEFIYEIRYDKKSYCGLEGFFQQANHLITQCKGYETSKLNFNFIFSGSQDKQKQWGILYTLLPILLTHTYHVIEAIFKSFAQRVNEKTDITDLKVMMGFFLLQKPFSTKMVKKVFSHIGLEKISCPSCSSYIKFSKENVINFYNGKILCKNCKNKFNLEIFSEEIVRKTSVFLNNTIG